jgi:hypothetical protein
VAEFSGWAKSQRSVAERDDTLAFESQILKDACQEWSRAAEGGIPRRSAFTPRSVRRFVGHMAIFERADDGHWLIRLMGTAITGVLGEMQGKTIDDALPADVAGRWTQALIDVLQTGQPTRIVNTLNFSNLDYLEAEIFLAPLLDDSGAARMIFTAVAFRSGVAPRGAVDEIVGPNATAKP